MLGLALLPSNPFHRGPDGVWSLEKTTQPIQAAASSAASGRLPTLQLLPELMGKLPFCFFFIRDFSFLKRGQGETTGRTSQEQRV